MTDIDLFALWQYRKKALDGMGNARWPSVDSTTTGTEWGRRFRESDAAITAELVRRGAPAELPGVTLHLTSDGLNFVALKPGTREALGGGRHSQNPSLYVHAKARKSKAAV